MGHCRHHRHRRRRRRRLDHIERSLAVINLIKNHFFRHSRFNHNNNKVNINIIYNINIKINIINQKTRPRPPRMAAITTKTVPLVISGIVVYDDEPGYNF